LTVALASVRTVADGAGEEALPDSSTANQSRGEEGGGKIPQHVSLLLLV
jgi:hypothetical protein